MDAMDAVHALGGTDAETAQMARTAADLAATLAGALVGPVGETYVTRVGERELSVGEHGRAPSEDLLRDVELAMLRLRNDGFTAVTIVADNAMLDAMSADAIVHLLSEAFAANVADVAEGARGVRLDALLVKVSEREPAAAAG